MKTGIDKVKYRYHYQKMDSQERIFRYDNAKHHPGFATFPHHKHVGPETQPDTVCESVEISLKEILEEITQDVMSHI